MADHAIEKMMERNISPRDLADALARPDQTYLQGTRRVYQYQDLSVVVDHHEGRPDRPVPAAMPVEQWRGPTIGEGPAQEHQASDGS